MSVLERVTSWSASLRVSSEHPSSLQPRFSSPSSRHSILGGIRAPRYCCPYEDDRHCCFGVPAIDHLTFSSRSSSLGSAEMSCMHVSRGQSQRTTDESLHSVTHRRQKQHRHVAQVVEDVTRRTTTLIVHGFAKDKFVFHSLSFSLPWHSLTRVSVFRDSLRSIPSKSAHGTVSCANWWFVSRETVSCFRVNR
jgi:hypothetical protein